MLRYLGKRRIITLKYNIKKERDPLTMQFDEGTHCLQGDVRFDIDF